MVLVFMIPTHIAAGWSLLPYIFNIDDNIIYWFVQPSTSRILFWLFASYNSFESWRQPPIISSHHVPQISGSFYLHKIYHYLDQLLISCIAWSFYMLTTSLLFSDFDVQDILSYFAGFSLRKGTWATFLGSRSLYGIFIVQVLSVLPLLMPTTHFFIWGSLSPSFSRFPGTFSSYFSNSSTS